MCVTPTLSHKASNFSKKKDPSYSQKEIESLLIRYKKKVDDILQESMVDLGTQTKLRDACQYALLNGGKRFRPLIVFLVAEALNNGFDVSDAALSIEYFHCASLIADDLPCMDNDDLRRDMPSLHKVYGEATALLTTYALIASGYQHLKMNADKLKQVNHPINSTADSICVLALENASYNSGILGASGGQYLDIYPSNVSIDLVKEVITRKTISLFEISFVFGWLFGGGETIHLPKVKQLAAHFGLAFQVSDDIKDMEQDIKNERPINMASFLGKEKALALVEKEVNCYIQLLDELRITTPAMKSLGALILNHANTI